MKSGTATPRIIGIAGGSASGKTELARKLADRFADRATLLSQDWYYRDQSQCSAGQRAKLNFDHPRAFDAPLLRKHLRALLAKKSVPTPRYDYSRQRRLAESVPAHSADIIIVEGLLILNDPRLRDVFDFSVFVEAPADVRLLRRLRRDVEGRGIAIEETLRLYEHCVRPMHDLFVQPSARHASVIWNQMADRGFPARLTRQLKKLLS